jgi:hypothetical protein
MLLPMTKVQITFPLTRPLTDSDLNRISHMHSVYGFNAVRLTPSVDALFVEYDASRLSPTEVRGALEHNGLPIGAPTPLPQAVKPEPPAG